MRKINVLSLCDGISGGALSLLNITKNFNYIAVEIDKKPRSISNKNLKFIERSVGHDVYSITERDIKLLQNIDLFLAGPECTSLSSQGCRTDWDGKSKIFYKCVEILGWVKKYNPDVKFFFENVASMRLVCRDEISNQLGVKHFLGDSSLTSGQGRKRYYWFNWEAPKIKDKNINCNDILEDDGLHIVAFTKSNRNKIGDKPVVKGRQRKDFKAATITTGEGGRGQSTINLVVTKKLKTRPLTIRECARLQSLPDTIDFSDVPITATFKAIGNGWEIGMVTEILKMTLKDNKIIK